MRYFIDFEFIENGLEEPIYPLSVGIVSEDNREYYAEYTNAPLRFANKFVREHVLPNLRSYKPEISEKFLVPSYYNATDLAPKVDFTATLPNRIKEEIIAFCGWEPEFWGYFCDYDWVCLCQTMGQMSDLPNGWPMYCLDIKQEMHMRHIKKDEITKAHPQPTTHNALDDAKWNKEAFDFIESNYLNIGG